MYDKHQGCKKCKKLKRVKIIDKHNSFLNFYKYQKIAEKQRADMRDAIIKLTTSQIYEKFL